MPFNNLSDPEMIAKSATVAEAFTPAMYAHLVSLLPTPDAYLELHNRFEASFTANLKGDDPEKAKACEADRNALNEVISMLHGMAKVVTIKDPTVPEKLRLIQEKIVAATIHLTAPNNLKAAYDPQGRLMIGFSKVTRAKIYEIWVCDGDPSLEQNWKLSTSTATCRPVAIPGLDRTKTNWLKVRAKNVHETGPWSNCISLDPL
jgi:hypothetical protein